MANLVVNHTVPFVASQGKGSLVFSKWLPEGIEHAISLSGAGCQVRVWLDRTCVQSFEPLTDERIRVLLNMSVMQLFIDVIPDPIDEALADFIASNSNWPKAGSILDSEDSMVRSHARSYQELGWKVLREVLSTYDRIVSWAYAEKGQHWLFTRGKGGHMMMSANNEFRARAAIDQGVWFRWCPPNPDSVFSASGTLDGLGAADWQALALFLSEKRRPNLIGELLSNAFSLFAAGHYRAAVIEGVSALEVALREWARNPDPTFLHSEVPDRVLQGRALAAVVEHLGFLASVSYLLPVVIRQDHLAQDIVSGSVEAINARNNIVHHGQREVAQDKAERHLLNVRKLARGLQTLTAKRSASTA